MSVVFKMTLVLPAARKDTLTQEEMVGRILEEVGAAIASGDVGGLVEGTFRPTSVPGSEVGWRTV